MRRFLNKLPLWVLRIIVNMALIEKSNLFGRERTYVVALVGFTRPLQITITACSKRQARLRAELIYGEGGIITIGKVTLLPKKWKPKK